MKTRAALALLVGLVALASAAAPALAAPTVITTKAAPDAQSGEYVVFVGGIDENGRSLKAQSIEAIVGGQPLTPPPTTQSLADWAVTSSEHSKTWHPPVAVGLVYLWIEGVPSGVLEGVHSFFERIPSRTNVNPTVYGRMRQGRASLAAADISRLDEVPYLDSYKPNLSDAIRLDMNDLAAAEAPIKLLLIISDGRDYADPKGQGPGDFGAIGRAIRKAGITPLIVGFPAPEGDAAQAQTNLRELHDAAGGFMRLLDQPEDLENTLESLGQAVGEMQRVQFPVSWSWRVFGGSKRETLPLVTGGGQRLNADVGVVEVAGGTGMKVGVFAGIVVVVAVLGLVLFLVFRRRGGGGDDEDVGGEDDEILQAAHDLIRRGVPPRRAVDELTRTFGDAAASLVDIDPELLNDARYPYFRTRVARMRMQEMRDLLANKSAEAPAIGPAIAEVLAAAIADRTPPEQAADTLFVRASADECTAFAALGSNQLTEALRAVGRDHPELAAPRARGVVVAIQDALRTRGSAARNVSVGWLVRASGPGTRGETLRLEGSRVVIGSGPQARIRLAGDPNVAPEHAEIAVDGGEFTLTALGGKVSVESKPVAGRHELSDGETIQVGAGMFVFKCANAGNMLARTGS